MGALKPVLRLFGTLFAVLYCGWLDYYFLHQSGSLKEAENDGLGPTVFGLGIVGLFFLIMLIVQILLVFVSLRSRRSGGDRTTRHNDDDDDGFDPDAVIARYMARQSAEAASNVPSMPTRPEGGGPPRRPGFGRKNK